MSAALSLVLKDRPYIVALLLGLVTQLLLMFHIEFPSHIFFDETHYVPAAKAILELSSPRNVEHPMLGKELIALGIWLFGDNPLGWRLVPSLAASATVMAGFSFLWLLTRQMRPAVIGALLMMFNQTLFIQGRIAMLDVFLGAFLIWAMVLMLWAMHGEPRQVLWRWLGASVLLGLAIAVKWSAVPYVALAGVAFVALRARAANVDRASRIFAFLAWVLGGAALVWMGRNIVLVLLRHLAPSGPPAFFNDVPALLTLWHIEPFILPLALAGLGVGAVFWWRGTRAAFAQMQAATPVAEAGHNRWPGLDTFPALAMLAGVSLIVYFLTFLPAFFYEVEPLTLARLIPLQGEMLALQEQVLKPHPYQSDWWSWALMLRPMWYFYEYDADAQRGVLLLGNPLILWGGLVAVIACLRAWFRDKATRPLAVALLWIASLAIYIVIPKSLGFYYYYYLSSIFICFAIAVAFQHFDRGRGRGLEEWFTALSLLVFFYFYPIISAWPLRDGQSFTWWMWLDSWR